MFLGNKSKKSVLSSKSTISKGLFCRRCIIYVCMNYVLAMCSSVCSVVPDCSGDWGDFHATLELTYL